MTALQPLCHIHVLRNTEHPSGLYEHYLRILDVPRHPPGLAALTQLTAAHLTRIPFENLSKLYFRRRTRGVPDLESYLDGIERYRFGGTCYANAQHFNRLLNHLGYEVALCGADMSAPDVHMVNVVTLDSGRYLVDVGYAAPFYHPMPLHLPHDLEIPWGPERYVIKPSDTAGRTRVELHRDGVLRHSYSLNPAPRRIEEFERVIANSFSPKSAFMNELLIASFYPERSLSLRNLALIEAGPRQWSRREIPLSELLQTIEDHFGIPHEIARDALEGLPLTQEP